MDDYDWQTRMARAFTQRIYLVDGRAEAQEYHFKVMGNTNNAYDIVLSPDQVWCSCPDCDARGNFCKHLMFVMIRAIGIDQRQVFENQFTSTPQLLERCADYFTRRESALQSVAIAPAVASADDKRKPIEDDDECPICYESFKDTADEPTVWCKSSCGKSVHTSCFKKWSQAKRKVDCVYCRAVWK